MKARKRSYTQTYVQGLITELMGLREHVKFLQSHLNRQTEVVMRLVSEQVVVKKEKKR